MAYKQTIKIINTYIVKNNNNFSFYHIIGFLPQGIVIPIPWEYI
ncbi:hypothetical protein DCCM_3142 [Desulfocucumis palustris]|uniref:Uncharacterized protein n=1 Tax=Desulfocucumis palustris TaxID=1898651 RepID=A0A2L2XJC5_9FIRM|nr:hypothetical protein DCCM_3142 [Desulfocucumis palustris]